MNLGRSLQADRENRTPRRLGSALALLLFIVFAYPIGLLAQEEDIPTVSELRLVEDRFQEVAERVMPSVVAIRTVVDAGTGRHWERATGQGSGFIIDPTGLILTNEHVVAGARRITAQLPNRGDYVATLVSSDPRRDLAVIKIDAANLPAVTYADPESVKVGKWALAFGNPFGLANSDGKPSLSVGVVSALGQNLTEHLERAEAEDRFYGNLIQTSAGINPGNSGGPLFDIDGKVMGIVVAVAVRPDIAKSFGFATPMTPQVHSAIDKLAEGKQVEYGMIGAKVTDLSRADLASLGFGERKGARIVTQPLPGTAAAAAGLEGDDFILNFNGIDIESADHLIDVVGDTPIGATVPVRYVRAGSYRTALVKVAARNVSLTSAVNQNLDDPVLDGVFEWADTTLKSLSTMPDVSGRKGIVVISVPENSIPYHAGLRERDNEGNPTVIVRVNGKTVTDMEDFRQAVLTRPNRVSLELADGGRVRVQF